METVHTPKENQTDIVPFIPLEQDGMTARQALLDPRSIPYVPLNDFNWRYLMLSVSDPIEVTELEHEEVNMLGNGRAEHIKIRAERTLMQVNTIKVKKLIGYRSLITALKSLDERKDLPVVQLLNEVHADRDCPYFICARAKEVNVSALLYVRPEHKDLEWTDPTYWVTNSNKAALTRLKHHSAELFKFVLVLVIDFLEPGICVIGEDRFACLKLRSDDEFQYVVYVTFVRQKEPLLNVKLCEKRDVFPCVYGKSAKDVKESDARYLSEYVRDRKREMFETLDKTSVSDDQINEFLERARDAGLGFDIPEDQIRNK